MNTCSLIARLLVMVTIGLGLKQNVLAETQINIKVHHGGAGMLISDMTKEASTKIMFQVSLHNLGDDVQPVWQTPFMILWEKGKTEYDAAKTTYYQASLSITPGTKLYAKVTARCVGNGASVDLPGYPTPSIHIRNVNDCYNLETGLQACGRIVQKFYENLVSTKAREARCILRKASKENQSSGEEIRSRKKMELLNEVRSTLAQNQAAQMEETRKSQATKMSHKVYGSIINHIMVHGLTHSPNECEKALNAFKNRLGVIKQPTYGSGDEDLGIQVLAKKFIADIQAAIHECKENQSSTNHLEQLHQHCETIISVLSNPDVAFLHKMVDDDNGTWDEKSAS